MKLLVGYGNTMRQDDGVGWLIASQLAPRYDSTDVQITSIHQLMPEIAATAAQAERVVFVDASIGDRAGQVQVSEIHPSSSIADAHIFDPPDILYLADSLYGRCPPAFLVTITGADFELGDNLSDAVQAAIPQAIAMIEHLLAE